MAENTLDTLAAQLAEFRTEFIRRMENVDRSLRTLTGKVQAVEDVQGQHTGKLDSLIVRAGELEVTVARAAVPAAEMSLRVDKLGTRLERIERRLGLLDAEAS